MKVAIIEDGLEITEAVTIAFETAWPGSELVGASNAAEGRKMLRTQNPDVVIMDVRLQEGDASGLELIKEFRTFSDAPVIMVTAQDRDVDVVPGLESGASDYLVKPFSAVELLARIRAIMRRTQVGSLGSEIQAFVSRELSVDFDNRQVLAHGEPVMLTPTEYKLLCYLVRNPRQILTKDAILSEVWDEEQDRRRLIKTHIHRLRKKLKDDLLNPRLILTVRGQGYQFVGGG